MKKPIVLDFTTHSDRRGNLSFLEELIDVPFEMKRVYWITNIPEQQVRGGHAHKTDEQVIICLRGKAKVILETRKKDLFECELCTSDKGLYIPPKWWGKMILSENALLLGLSSQEFDEDDYIRNRQEFDGEI